LEAFLVKERWQEEADEHNEDERTMESKPTGQKRYLILVPRTKRRDNRAPSFASPLLSTLLSLWLACLPAYCRVVPKPDEAGSSAAAILKESIRLRDPGVPGSSTFYGLEKANGSRWKGLRNIPPRPPGQSQWEPSGEDGQNSIENPMIPKVVIRRRCRETKEQTRVSWKSSGRQDVDNL
jgi:hypothetical protein